MELVSAIYQPEQEIDDLSREVRDVTELLHAAERVSASAHEELTIERTTRLAAERLAQSRYEEFTVERTARLTVERLARSAQDKLQRHAAARLFAENRIAELNDASQLRAEELLAVQRELAELKAERQKLAEAEVLQDTGGHPAVLGQPELGVEGARPGNRIRMVGRYLPKPFQGALRGPARLVRSTIQGIRQDRPPTPPPSVVEAPPTSLEPDKPQIVCNGRIIGEVNWWTLAAAVTRLRRFGLFDGEDYLRRNSDVAAAGIDPHTHFIQSGALEGRGRVDPEELARVMSGFILFDHAVRAIPPPPETSADLPSLVADIRHIGIYVSSYGNMFMEEIADDLAADLRSVGVEVDVLDENASIDQRPPVCLFVAPHEFFLLGRGPEWVRDDVFSTGFMFGTEQVQTTWFNLALPFILMSRAIIDLCPQTAALFEHTGMAALHALPGVRLQPHGLTERDKQHPLFRVLPEAAQGNPDPRRPYLDRPIDIAFFGNSSPRRDKFFARNAAFLSEYETFNYCRHSDRGPILGTSEDGALTRLAGHVSGHSKITLNIHREEFGYFEWHRMVRLGMCSGSLVVSDPCLPHPSFIANEHYLQESTRRIPDLLEWLLKTEDGNREAERIRSNADGLITGSFDNHHTMLQMLRFLSLHRSRDGEPASGREVQ